MTAWVERELSEIARMCVDGRRVQAALELQAWTRRDDCPATARLLLAALWAEDGDLDAAIASADAGRQSDAHDNDPALQKVAICLRVEADLPDSARRLAAELFETHGHDPAIGGWLAAMQPPGTGQMPGVSASAIEQLSGELIESLDVVPALVAGLAAEPNRHDTELLRQALCRLADDAADDAQLLLVCRAVTKLSLLLDDADEVRRWAHRGLKVEPYCAQLALALAETPDELTLGPPASEVLRRVAATHPTYPDVRAALIRRERTDGMADVARLRLAEWLEQDPENPVALGLVREMAA